jgi:hypothetical protein
MTASASSSRRSEHWRWSPGSAPRPRAGLENRPDVIPQKLGLAEESGLEVDVSSGSNTVNIEISEDGKARVAK